VESSTSATIADGPGETGNLHPRHAEWIKARGISVELARKFGLETVQRDGRAWLAVPYVERGQVVNHKYRLISEKRHQMDKGGRIILWNRDCLLEQSKTPVVICEGEWDALTAIGLGYRAISVPNGASSADGKLDYLWEDRDALNAVQDFIIATDSDEAGIKLRANLVAHLGADRCRFIESYGADCKDLNDALQLYGTEWASELLLKAKPVPVKGLYRIDDFPERGEIEAWPVGIEPLRDRLFIVPGTLTVVTGYANMGKSTIIDCVVADLLKRGVPTCIASFETDVKPILLNGLRCTILGCGHHELHHFDIAKADALIRDKLTIITQIVGEAEEMDLEYFIDLCRATVSRDGTRVIILDPWNELEHKERDGENETRYTGRALRALRTFAKQHNVAIWVVAHPSKPFEGKVRQPFLLDISGSANWANKPDFGLSYHRPNPEVNEATLYVCKVRKGYPGKKGGVKVTFDFRTSSFREAA
jgi:twinkle protein